MFYLEDSKKITEHIVIERVWETKSGLRAKVILNRRLGHRCGYVCIKTNKIKKLLYSYICDKEKEKYSIEEITYLTELTDKIVSIPVHGGMTFDNYDDKNGTLVVGFDANHLGDEPDIDSMLKYSTPEEKEYLKTNIQDTHCFDYSDYRSLEYMINECEKLSSHLIKIFQNT